MLGIKDFICLARSLTAVEQSDLRDEFAKAAMAAMIGNTDKDYTNRGKAGVPKIAAWAYEYADAMLAAREATPCA